MAVAVARRSRGPAPVGLVGLAGLALATTAVDDGPVLCGFRLCTGGYCPGCGGSRAAAALLGGDVVGAWHQHPWVVLIAAQVAVVIAATVVMRSMVIRVQPLLYANLVLGLGIWVVRLSLGHIPAPF